MYNKHSFPPAKQTSDPNHEWSSDTGSEVAVAAVPELTVD